MLQPYLTSGAPILGKVGPTRPTPSDVSALPLPVGSDFPVLALGVRYVPLSGDPGIDGVLDGGRAWASTTITYAFPDSSGDYAYPYGIFDEPFEYGFGQVSSTQRRAVTAILEGTPGSGVSGYGSVEAITPLNLVYAGSNNGDLRIAQTGLPFAPAWTYRLTEAPEGGDTWFYYGPEFSARSPVLGHYAYFAHIHELLHALGLKDGSISGPILPYDRDSLEFSAVSYRSFVGSPLDGYRNEWFGFPQTPMMLDIAALQHLYGADFTTQSGNTAYRWNPDTGEMSVNGVAQGVPGANRVFLTIWDGGGTDTYDLSNYATPVSIDLAPGGWSVTSTAQLAVLNDYDGYVLARGNVFNALQYRGDPRSLIENAVGGSAGDMLRGNAAANRLEGQGGADTLDGGSGADTLAGGSGLDQFLVTAGSDVVTDLGLGGADGLVVSGGASVSATLAGAWSPGGATQNAGSAVLQAGGFSVDLSAVGGAAGWMVSNAGSAGAVRLVGSAMADTLVGGSGADTLDGGVGADSMAGGAGNDGYWVDAPGDVVTELAGDGTDTVRLGAAITGYDLPVEVEHALVLGAQGAQVFGNVLVNKLTGGAGNDTLVGDYSVLVLGPDMTLGLADTLIGGGGNDWLFADALDQLSGGEGFDVLIAADDRPFDVNLAAAGIEYVVSGFGNDTYAAAGAATAIEVFAGGGNDSLAGSGLADRLWGGVGNDTILGGEGDDVVVGDLGADSLSGGAGNDRIYIDPTDTVQGGTGTDAAYIATGSGIALDLAATGFEWVADFAGGADTLDATGLATAVELYGGGGNDRLLGGTGHDLIFAGAGNDTLVGGEGDDALVGEAGADSLSGGGGNDRIYADATDLVNGGAGFDALYLAGDLPFTADLGLIRVEWLLSGAGSDAITTSTTTAITVYAGGGADTVAGGGGNDFLWAEGGNDSLSGGAGNDVLVGGTEADTLAGLEGNDALHGGAGADLFVLTTGWGTDTIFDWQDGEDWIDLRPLGVTNMGALSISGSGGTALVGFGADTLRIANAAGLIGAEDFLFA